MRIVFFGDVVGKSGRDALVSYIATNKKKLNIDFVIVNGENSAHGFGITQRICDQFFDIGVNAITLGNHTFDQKDNLQLFDREKRLIRPINYPKGTPGRGMQVFDVPFLNKKVLVINAIGRLFLEQNDDPFQVIPEQINGYVLGNNIDAIFIDFHAEATAEKVAMARYLDGKITALVGTHTHVPTADAQILQKGTGYLTDCGMCGDYDSCIGMHEESPIKRFTSKVDAYARMRPAEKEATVCGVLIDVNQNGLCDHIETIRSGGFLKEQQN
ncbi:MAG: TIGR00282 family metallophosphoesterase [Alphaproteobacteria bacterium]|nr:TIGR00282 family metallophosphoesterase [Alphaproteobacteria bacterium]